MSDPSPAKALLPAVQIAFIAAAAAAVFSFVTVTKEGELRRRCTALCSLRPEYAGADRKAPDFALKDMNGKELRLSELRGKVVVMNFWTKTCNPCLKEMPAIAELAKVLRPKKDVALITVSTDEGPHEVKDLLHSLLGEEPPFPVLFDPDSKVVGGQFGTHLYPETWVIDQRGIIRARFDGARDWTSAAVVEVVEHIRGGGYCPVEIKDGKPRGEAAALCAASSG